jgi:hypothetical protein
MMQQEESQEPRSRLPARCTGDLFPRRVNPNGQSVKLGKPNSRGNDGEPSAARSLFDRTLSRRAMMVAHCSSRLTWCSSDRACSLRRLHPTAPRCPGPHVELSTTPTPFERLARLHRGLGAIAVSAGHAPAVDVWIKGDVLMSIGLGQQAAHPRVPRRCGDCARGRHPRDRRTGPREPRPADRGGSRSGRATLRPRPYRPAPAVPSPGRTCELIGTEIRFATESSVLGAEMSF